jgi:hypothetical protein
VTTLDVKIISRAGVYNRPAWAKLRDHVASMSLKTAVTNWRCPAAVNGGDGSGTGDGAGGAVGSLTASLPSMSPGPAWFVEGAGADGAEGCDEPQAASNAKVAAAPTQCNLGLAIPAS